MNINVEEYGKVVCAALLHNDCIYMSTKGHYAIFPMEPIGVLKKAEQGFVTENGYFVDRKLGLIIANYYGQIVNKHNPIDSLMSEDFNNNEYKLLKRLNKYSYKTE